MSQANWVKMGIAGVILFVALVSPAWASDPNNIVATPVFSPDGGIYNTEPNVIITCTTAGATIRYTLDGSDPNNGTIIASGSSVFIDHSLTLKAVAQKEGMTTSAGKSATYQIVVATPAFSVAGGTYNTEKTVVITCVTSGAIIHYTTNGLDPTESDPNIASGSSVLVDRSLTLKAKAWKGLFTPSPVKSATYNLIVSTPAFSVAGGIYNTEKTVVITCATSGAAIHYTTNGLDPTESDPVITSGSSIFVDQYLSLKARAWKGNMTPSSIQSATYQLVAAMPVFTPDGGTYNTERNVIITCATPGATIRYTLDGSDPNGGSVYDPNSTILIDHSLTLKAKAWKTGFTPSSVKSATYQLIVATPVFSPSGSYPNLFVTITCATSGATIHYTTNGIDPNESDPVIVSGFNVIIDHDLTLKAAAWKENFNPSGVRSAFYQLQPVPIASKTDLMAMASNTTNYDKCFILTEDIDLEGQIFATAIIASDTSSSYHFQGIHFTGTFDGNGHKIINLTINGGNNDFLGLFGYIGAGGQIKNLCLENFSVIGTSSDSDFNGGLAGYNYHGNIIQCNLTGTVRGKAMIGGLVGYNDTGDIENCSVSGTVSSYSQTGGLIGFNSYGDITNCYSLCNIDGHSTSGGLVGTNESGNISNCHSKSSVGGTNDTGGLVGFNRGSITDCYTEGSIINTGDFKFALGGLVGYNRGSIRRCYSTCFTSISNSSSAVGGLVGETSVGGSISDCYSVGAVNGISAVGGLVGIVGNGGSVSNCYSIGTVNGSSDIGGLVGEYYDGAVTNSFWDMQTSGRTTSAAGTGKTTAQMKSLSTFISEPNNWDFSTFWTICEGSNYPKLIWQVPEPDWVCPDGVNLEDLDYFVEQWLKNGCNTSNNYCGGGDVDASGEVDLADFIMLAENQRSGDPSSYVWIAGKIGNALSFDGINDYVVVPGYYGIGGTNARTVSLWFKTSVVRAHELVQWGSDVIGRLWLIRIQTNGTLLVSVSNGGVYSTKTVIDGQWHHITAVLDEGQTIPGQIRLYVDGVLDAVPQSATCTIDTAQTVQVHLGTWYLYSTGQFGDHYSGLMDDVRIYNRALAPNEIKPNALPETGLVTHWSMDEAVGTVAHDSASSYDGVLTNF